MKSSSFLLTLCQICMGIVGVLLIIAGIAALCGIDAKSPNPMPMGGKIATLVVGLCCTGFAGISLDGGGPRHSRVRGLILAPIIGNLSLLRAVFRGAQNAEENSSFNERQVKKSRASKLLADGRITKAQHDEMVK